MLSESVLSELTNQGYSTRQIASELGVSQLQVRYYLKRYGLQTKFSRRPHDFTSLDDEIRVHLPYCNSISELCLKLNKSHSGGSYKTLKNRIRIMSLSTDHFLTPQQIVSRNHKHRISNYANDVLVKYPVGKLNNWHLIKKAFLTTVDYICVGCGNTGEWNNAPLTLHMDHINGDKSDNRPDNLRLLCPNCHSQTTTFGSKNKKTLGG